VRLTIADKAVDMNTKYTVVTIDFLAGGGDNFFAPIDNLVVLDTLDEVLVEYIKKVSPVNFELDGRIAVVSGSAEDGGSGSGGDNGNSTTPTDSAPTPSTTPSGANSVGIVSGIVLLVWTALLAVVVM
jgi:5'-nucleotidase